MRILDIPTIKRPRCSRGRKNRTDKAEGLEREMSGGEDRDERGIIWRLPVLRTKHLGKVGPVFGYGAGCGVGLGFGLLGGAGFGAGLPGLQLGFGFGAGCGVGLGFGYGMGKGVAYDESRKYTNVGKLFQGSGNLPSQEQIGALFDELVINTKRLVSVTSREIDKWKR